MPGSLVGRRRMSSPSPTPRRDASPVAPRLPDRSPMNVLRSERFAAALLLVAAVLGLVIANLPFGPAAVELKDAHLDLPWLGLDLSAGHWISDGLLAIFFFIVAVELKRELVIGELNSLSKALLPAIAAVGGVIVPAAIFLAFTAGTPDRRRMADPDGDRHRLRARRARRVRPVPADPRAHLPARARGARRPHRDPHHRVLLHERRRPRARWASPPSRSRCSARSAAS